MPDASAIPDFRQPQLAKAVESLSPEAVNALPFGAVRLDSEGVVTFFSEAERRLSRYPHPAVGRSFFTDIAPCMNNAAFKGRIDRALEAGKLDIAFGYVGDYPSATAELEVRVQSAAGGGCWVFLKRED